MVRSSLSLYMDMDFANQHLVWLIRHLDGGSSANCLSLVDKYFQDKEASQHSIIWLPVGSSRPAVHIYSAAMHMLKLLLKNLSTNRTGSANFSSCYRHQQQINWGQYQIANSNLLMKVDSQRHILSINCQSWTVNSTNSVWFSPCFLVTLAALRSSPVSITYSYSLGRVSKLALYRSLRACCPWRKRLKN